MLIDRINNSLHNDLDSVIPVCNNSNEMNKEKWICDVESIIQYSFKDTELLKRAFTLKSSIPIESNNYETLEFIGDSFLDLIILERMEIEYNDFSSTQILGIYIILYLPLYLFIYINRSKELFNK